MSTEKRDVNLAWLGPTMLEGLLSQGAEKTMEGNDYRNSAFNTRQRRKRRKNKINKLYI